MPPDTMAWGILVPIVAIVGGIASGMLRMWTKHEQEMARINSAKQMQNGACSSSELEQLRDTTTRYDLSVDKALNETQQRLANVESKLRGEYVPASVKADETQRISSGGF